MTEAEALERAIKQLQVGREQKADNLYGRRYADRSRHPDRVEIEEILAPDDEAIRLLSAMRARLGP